MDSRARATPVMVFSNCSGLNSHLKATQALAIITVLLFGFSSLMQILYVAGPVKNRSVARIPMGFAHLFVCATWASELAMFFIEYCGGGFKSNGSDGGSISNGSDGGFNSNGFVLSTGFGLFVAASVLSLITLIVSRA